MPLNNTVASRRSGTATVRLPGQELLDLVEEHLGVLEEGHVVASRGAPTIRAPSMCSAR